MSVINDFQIIVNLGQNFDCFYVDIFKAFDTGSRPLIWITDYLTDGS